VSLSWNLGTLTSWNPLGHSRPVTGLILFYLFKDANLLYITAFFSTAFWKSIANGHCIQRKKFLRGWLPSLYERQHVTWQPSLSNIDKMRPAHFPVLRDTLEGCSVVQFFTHVVSTYPYVRDDLLTYILPAYSRVLLEKLTGLQLVKKFSAFYGTRKFITAFTSACHMSLSWASLIQSIPPVLDDTIRIWPQQAQHIYSTHKIQVTKNIYITACWIRLRVNPLTLSCQMTYIYVVPHR
jgi:hypothetical protein